MSSPLSLPNLQSNVSLAEYTTFKIGGPARWFVVVQTAEELLDAIHAARQAELPWFVLGGGSDILVADQGFPGLVIKSQLRQVSFNEELRQVTAGSGVLLASVIRQTLQVGWSGLEFAIGVPASVGGAIWANLGARGSQIQDVLETVQCLDADGHLVSFSAADCDFSYRDSIFKHQPFAIIEATFQLQPATKAAVLETINDLAGQRKQTQDVAAACAGCVFRNPTDQSELSAAALIDQAGLKGFSIGGAQVSTKHANFIINTGTATADDVVMLISYIKQQIRDRYGVQLREEIEYIGWEPIVQ